MALALLASILLASLFITTSLMGADLTAYSSIQQEINKLKVDLIYRWTIGYETEKPINFFTSSFFEDIYKQVSKVEGVKSVGILCYINRFFYSYEGVKDYFNITYGDEKVEITNASIVLLGFYKTDVFSNLTWVPKEIKDDEIFIPEAFSKELKIKEGDNLTMKFVSTAVGNESIGISNVTLKFAGDFPGVSDTFETYLLYPYQALAPIYGGTYVVYYGREEFPRYWLFLNASKATDIGLYFSYGEITVYVFVNVDRESLINPWDLVGSTRKISLIDSEINNKISAVIQQYAPSKNYIYSNNVPLLVQALTYTSFLVTMVRMRFIVFSIPVLLMGWFLALIANWIFLNERRKFFGLLKVRGTSDSTLRKGVLLEAIIIGVIGGAIGGFLTIIISSHVTSFVFGLNLPASLVSKYVWMLSETYVITGIILGIALSLLASWGPSKKAASLKIADALYEHLEEIEVEKINVRRYLIFLLIGLYGLIELITRQWILLMFISYIIGTRAFVLFFLFIVYALFEMFTIYLGPLLFAYTSLKLMMHYSDKLAPIFKGISRIFLGELSIVAAKNFVRKPARTARIAFLIVLMIGTAMAFNVSMATSINNAKVQIKYDIGADIAISDLSINYADYQRLKDNLSNIDGVNSIASYAYLDWIELSKTEFGSISLAIVGVNSTYFGTSYISDNHLSGAKVSELKDLFESKNKIYGVISKYVKDLLGKDVGDTIEIFSNRLNTTLTIKIAAVANFIPGFGYLAAQTSTYLLVPLWLIDNSTELLYSLSPLKILIDVKDGYNSTDVAENIEDLMEKMNIIGVIRDYQKEVKNIETGVTAILYRFTNYMFVFSGVITLIGVSLVMAMTAVERRREIALLKVRGFSNIQIILTFLAEVLIIALLAIALGFPIGVGYALQSLPQTYNLDPMTGEVIVYQLPPEMTIVIPSTTLIFFLIVVLGMLFSAIIPAYLMARRNIASEIRIVR